MEIDYRHSLGEDEAKARLLVLGEYLTNRHGIKVTWIDATRARFSGKYLVVKIEGELTMAPGIARFRGEDPGFLWRRKAADYIEGKLEKYLDAKTPIGELPRGKD
jgi:hypothetical protein